jgi:AraC-like DNA-binding protein
MFVIGLHLFSYFLYSKGFWDKYPHLTGISHPFPYLHGPFLFLYVVFSLRKDQHFRLKDFAHFLPAVLSYLYMIPFFFFYSVEQKQMVNSGQIPDFMIFMFVSLAGFVISGIAYPIMAYRLIGKYEKMIYNNFSYSEKINLNWLRYCIFGIGLIFLTVGILSILQYVVGINFPFNVDYVYYSEIILFIFFVGYFGIKHEGIFTETALEKQQIVETTAEIKQNAEYKKSGLKTEDAEIHHQKLIGLMTDKKLYLEPKLTLNALANELNISVNHLSQLINQYQNKNFYDFVNEYRVNEFKTRVSMTKYQHLSILAIAIDSGFNSKSSFNLVFKKHTGMTPSQFMAEKN